MTAMPWFRLYADIVDDELMGFLSFEDQRHYVWLLALKCAGTLDKEYPRDGMLDAVVGRKLGLQGDALVNMKGRLLDMGLIDDAWQPRGWERRQYVSDAKDPTAAERMRRYRAKQRLQGTDQTASDGNEPHQTVTDRNAPVTLLLPDSDTDTDTDRDNPPTPQTSSQADQPGHLPAGERQSLPIQGAEWLLPDDYAGELLRVYPPEYLTAQFARMRMWLVSNPNKKPTARGVKRFVNGWLDRNNPDGGSYGKHYTTKGRRDSAPVSAVDRVRAANARAAEHHGRVIEGTATVE